MEQLTPDELLTTTRTVRRRLDLDRPVDRGVIEECLELALQASIVPAVWSLMLALRARGLGSAWTTLTLQREGDLSGVLDIPGGHTHVGVFPVAYTIGTEFRRAERRAPADVLHWNRWGAHS